MTEIEIQKIIHKIISDPSIIRKTETGRRLQILSPGRINPFEGPDFSDMAVLLDGLVVIGDAEIHKKASDWINHNHSEDENYNRVILHIVLEYDKKINANFETLVITKNQVNEFKEDDSKKTEDLHSLDEIQHFALIRLLRKSSDAQKLITVNGLFSALNELVVDYINRYNLRRKRPVYNNDKLSSILAALKYSAQYKFLLDIEFGEEISVSDRILELMKSKISDEGAHLRREILLNCVLPIAICLASESSRIALFLWYWSTPSLNQYGILRRKFPNLPQNYLWEQQGMLEYMKDYGSKPNIVKDVVNNYGFAEILSFYRVGNSVYESGNRE